MFYMNTRDVSEVGIRRGLIWKFGIVAFNRVYLV